jgi:lipopolysaccharide transport system ATP-binding protein
MNDSIIIVENLSKRYVLGRQAAKSDGLRHAVERAFRSPLEWLMSRRRSSAARVEEFWALRDVNFEIKEGEVVGFIGRNGAGKSTLLKILSRITEPTHGSIRMRGRISSLLEVGTGFHPELTGRENIFLNGAILGMARMEIKRKFDEIVAFAGLEKFLDTPVKRYSSGMYVRLAFAVAAHLEPEVLIVDEVLAVGDAEFQKKCLQKMGDVAHAGRTVLFVSHNMQAVARLCSRCILLHEGRIKLDGPSTQVANAYLNTGVTTAAAREWADISSAPGDKVTRFSAVRVRSGNGQVVDAIDIREPVNIELEYEVLVSGYQFLPHFSLRNQDGTVLFVAVDVDPEWRGRRRPPGRYLSTGTIPGNLLAEGFIYVQAVIMTLDPEVVHTIVEEAVAFRVLDDLTATNTARGDYSKAMPGLMRPLLKWTTSLVPRPGDSESVPQEANAGREFVRDMHIASAGLMGKS